MTQMDQTMTLAAALEQQREAEARWIEAKAIAKRVALAQYEAARQACLDAGIRLTPPRPPRAPKSPASTAMSHALRAARAAKTPEERARWAAATRAGLRAANAAKAAQRAATNGATT